MAGQITPFTRFDRESASGAILALAMTMLFLLATDVPVARADDELHQILQQWVASSANVERPSLATAQARFGGELSRHQLQTAVMLWSPTSVESLTSQFEWTVASSIVESGASDHIILTGMPRNDVDRAFIGRVDVHWNAETRRPTWIRFAGRGEAVSFATLRRRNTGVIQQAAFYPPSEAEPVADAAAEEQDVRTASATIISNSAIDATDTDAVEITQLLDRWEAASTTSQAWELHLQAFDFDNVFATEQRYYVMMRGDGGGTIEVCWEPVAAEPGSVDSERRNPGGTPFTLREGPARAWVFTPEEALFADTRSQLVRRLPLVSFDQFPWHKHPLHTPSCATFHLPVNADELYARFRWEIVSQNERRVHLQGTPADDEVSRCLSAVAIVLNATTCLPEEIRCVEAGGSHEHVMQVMERRVPIGLTADVILQGYAGFTPAPEKESEPQ